MFEDTIYRLVGTVWNHENLSCDSYFADPVFLKCVVSSTDAYRVDNYRSERRWITARTFFWNDWKLCYCVCPDSNCLLHEQKENALPLDLQTAINLFWRSCCRHTSSDGVRRTATSANLLTTRIQKSAYRYKSTMSISDKSSQSCYITSSRVS
jgi:hypothetical protein